MSSKYYSITTKRDRHGNFIERVVMQECKPTSRNKIRQAKQQILEKLSMMADECIMSPWFLNDLAKKILDYKVNPRWRKPKVKRYILFGRGETQFTQYKIRHYFNTIMFLTEIVRCPERFYMDEKYIGELKEELSKQHWQFYIRSKKGIAPFEEFNNFVKWDKVNKMIKPKDDERSIKIWNRLLKIWSSYYDKIFGETKEGTT